MLDSTWFSYALRPARALPGPVVEVHCVILLELAKARYRARGAQRHAGHLGAARTEEELWGEPLRPLGLGRILEVDTSGPAGIPRLAAALAPWHQPRRARPGAAGRTCGQAGQAAPVTSGAAPRPPCR